MEDSFELIDLFSGVTTYRDSDGGGARMGQVYGREGGGRLTHRRGRERDGQTNEQRESY